MLVFDARLDDPQVRPVTVGGTKESDAVLDVPFSDAVTLALCEVENWPAVAAKVPLVRPAPIVKGVAAEMLPAVPIVTAAPPALAAALSVTVQLVAAPGPSDVGLQVFEATVRPGSVTVPAAALMETNVPSVATAMAPPVAITTAVEPDTVPDMVAITPLAMVLVFEPLAIHV